MTQTIEHLPGAYLPNDSKGIPVNGYIEYDIPEPADPEDIEDVTVVVEPVDHEAIDRYDKAFDIALDKHGSPVLARASLEQAGIYPPKGYEN